MVAPGPPTGRARAAIVPPTVVDFSRAGEGAPGAEEAAAGRAPAPAAAPQPAETLPVGEG